MVSDQEIASCVESLLRQSDPAGVTASMSVRDVVQQVEAKLGLDLAHKAGFIRDQINLIYRSPVPASRDHLGFQPQHHLQPQFLAGHNHPIIPHHQISSSPFTHFPQHHDLAFRSAPSVSVQPHHLLQPQQSPAAQQPPSVQSPAAAPVVVNQEDNAKARSSGKKGAKKNAGTGVKRRGGPGGLSKVCGVSSELQAIVGEATMSRTEIVKQLWAYIRKNNLQDPNNKRKIICNDELRLVFETDSTDMFKMNKLLAKHITTLESSKQLEPDEKKLKSSEPSPSTESEADASPVLISDELAKFFGTGNREMFQSEALSRIWDYIKAYQLKDPLNAKMIRCDAKLQQLFGCESLPVLGVSEMLGRHLFKQS